MITLVDIGEKLESYDLCISNIYPYFENNRYYHNLDHILDLLNKAKDKGVLTERLFLAILFHDIIYSTKKLAIPFNEYRSAKFFKKLFKNKISKDALNSIYYAIISTKDHKPISVLSYRLIQLDLYILNDSSLEEFIKYEDAIRKEYISYDDDIYYKHRIPILESFGVSEDKIKYVKSKYEEVQIKGK